MRKYTLVIYCLSAIILTSCQCNREPLDEKYLEGTLSELEKEEQLESNIELVKEIIYSLPSPLETAMMIKRSGANFNSDDLLNSDNCTNYVTLDEMSIALGMYSADLSFASLFDQTQHTINYMYACRTLAEQIGILNVVSDEVMQKLESNINNRDVILEIISELLMNTNQILHDENRDNLSVLTLVGSWLEGMHIAIATADRAKTDKKELIDRILEQKLAMENIYRIMVQFKNDSQMKRVFKEIKELKKSFDLIHIKTEQTERIDDAGKVILRSKRKFYITDSDYKKLKKQIIKMRNNFVK